MSESHAPDLVLRLSLPAARDYAGVAVEAAAKIVELLGHGADEARAAGEKLEALVAEVVPDDRGGDVAFEFHHANGELRIEVRCSGRSSRASHKLPA